MGILFSLIKTIIIGAVVAGAGYYVADNFNLLPTSLQPAALKSRVNQALVADASSDSMTSSMSRSMHKYLAQKPVNDNAQDQVNAPNALNKDAKQDATEDNFIMAPINKAKKELNQYQKSIDDEKKTLDNI